MSDKRRMLILEQRVELLEEYQLEIGKLLIQDGGVLRKASSFRGVIRKVAQPIDRRLVKYRKYNLIRQKIYKYL